MGEGELDMEIHTLMDMAGYVVFAVFPTPIFVDKDQCAEQAPPYAAPGAPPPAHVAVSCYLRIV